MAHRNPVSIIPGSPVPRRRGRRAFTLIELLIVVAIIAILAAIALPNFLEAQVRARVSRVHSDLRMIATGLEAYRVDYNAYPTGTDNPNWYDEKIATALGPLAAGYYTLATRNGTAQTAGRDFATLTTPVAYASYFPSDPFVPEAPGFFTYSYRNARVQQNGFVLTSFGPDSDMRAELGGRLGVGTLNPNPLSTFSDTKVPARLGDINENAVIQYYENSNVSLVNAVNALGGLKAALADLAYDPTNGTVSDGDIFRIRD